MRLLDPKQVSAAKAQERKLEIDEGMKIAKRVDALREALVQEEQNVAQFRAGVVPKLQEQIAELCLEVDRKKEELDEANRHLALAREPLDKEWAELHADKAEVEVQQGQISISMRELSEWEASLERDRKDIERGKERLDESRQEITQAQREVRTLHQQKEGELAKVQKIRSEMEREYSQKLQIVSEKEKTIDYDIKHYEDFLAELNKREHALDLWERRLTIKENAKRQDR